MEVSALDIKGRYGINSTPLPKTWQNLTEYQNIARGCMIKSEILVF